MTMTAPGIQYPEFSGMDVKLAAALRNVFDNLNYLRGGTDVQSANSGTLYPDKKPVLSASDAGVRFFATDFRHWFTWDGKDWVIELDDIGIIVQSVLELGAGWHVCDGATGVRHTDPDGATSTFDVPDLGEDYFVRL